MSTEPVHWGVRIGVVFWMVFWGVRIGDKTWTKKNMNQLDRVPMTFSCEMAVYTRLNKYEIFVSRMHPSLSSSWLFDIFRLSIWSIRSKLEKTSKRTLPVFWGPSSLKWDHIGEYCRFPHNSPYFRALFQSNTWITIKISKSWNF